MYILFLLYSLCIWTRQIVVSTHQPTKSHPVTINILSDLNSPISCNEHKLCDAADMPAYYIQYQHWSRMNMQLTEVSAWKKKGKNDQRSTFILNHEV